MASPGAEACSLCPLNAGVHRVRAPLGADLGEKMTQRPDFLKFHNGNAAVLPFSQSEYEERIYRLRSLMIEHRVETVILTSMHNIAYYTGFLYCSFGRPYGAVVTMNCVTTVSAGIDAGQPWRRGAFDNVTYTDWRRDNYWRAVKNLVEKPGKIGVEGDHLTLQQHEKIGDFLGGTTFDMAMLIMELRLIKSAAQIDLIKHGAQIADIGGDAIRDAIRPGTREIDVAMAGRDAMELEIAGRFPDAEYRDTWVWFQSGLNTDGAHNPVTGRRLIDGDILSLNTFPMISGYYTALERTLFLSYPDAASLKHWEANIEAHELGLGLIKPGASCAEICKEMNAFYEDRNLLQYRSFGYGHSFGVLSHYYGREAGLELREDIETVLEPGMVVSMEPMITIPEGQPGAGGYREHDILVVTETGAENITSFPYGPNYNIVAS